MNSTGLKFRNAVLALYAAFTLGSDGEVSGMNFLGVNFRKAKSKAAAQFSGR